MDWLNEPPSWNVQGDTLLVIAGPKTDFWRSAASFVVVFSSGAVLTEIVIDSPEIKEAANMSDHENSNSIRG